MADYEDEPPILLPCAICGRTFKPQSLEKHTIICERSTTKKRKPFDSAKQRIQGTELEDFLPKETKKRISNEDRSTNSWKQSHDDFIKTIRAARGGSVEATPACQLAPIAASGAPTRANEKGVCPSCNRQFGIKAYDRHVAWCKERVTRMPSSPATNMAKERLEARMKYRAPALKNRRITNREKYSPNSNLKSTPTSLSLKPKGRVSLPSCIKSLESHSPVSLKQPAIPVRKIGHGRGDGLMPPGPVKSRLSDRTSNRHLHVIRSVNDDPQSSTLLPPSSHLVHLQGDEQCQKFLINIDSQNVNIKGLKRPKFNTAFSRSRGNSKVCDIVTHADGIDVIGQPSNSYKENCLSASENLGLITWDQIAWNQNLCEKLDDEKEPEWIQSVQKLGQTYSVRESCDADYTLEASNTIGSMRKSDLTEIKFHKSLANIRRSSTPLAVEELSLSITEDFLKQEQEDNDEVIKFNTSLSTSEVSPPKPVDLVEFSKVTLIPPIRVPEDISIATDSFNSAKSNEVAMRKRLRKKMSLLRKSTDSLVSSFEASTDQPKNPSVRKSLLFPTIPAEQRSYTFYQGRRKVSYWERAIRNSKSRFIALAQQKLESSKSPTISLPVISLNQSVSEQDQRPAWSSYVRRRPDFNLILKGRTGISADYDPFLLAERQMLDLLSDTCSDQSFTDSTRSQHKPSSPHYPLTHSSAFVKYPNQITLDNPKIDKRSSLIAPPIEFDDLSTGFSSDSTETNSISRELFADRNQTNKSSYNNSQFVLGRKVIIDKSKALGQISDVFGEPIDTNCKDSISVDKNKEKSSDKTTSKIMRPQVSRSNSLRAASAPKIPERHNSIPSTNRSASGSGFNSRNNNNTNNNNNGNNTNNNNNNYGNLSGSNLSLSSIVSSEVEVKRSNSVFEDLVSSFDDDVSSSYPSLRSLLKNDCLSSSVVPNRNGQISDEDLSSPDSYNKKDSNKLSGDSAYSSLNRKYFNGRSTNDVAGKLDEDTLLCRRDHEMTSSLRSKMSKFCHECGTRFPETAKFCCECGIQRLAL